MQERHDLPAAVACEKRTVIDGFRRIGHGPFGIECQGVDQTCLTHRVVLLQNLFDPALRVLPDPVIHSFHAELALVKLRIILFPDRLPELLPDLQLLPRPEGIGRDDLAVLRQAAGGKPVVQVVRLCAEGLLHLLQRSAVRAVCGHAEGQQHGIWRQKSRFIRLCSIPQQRDGEIRRYGGSPAVRFRQRHRFARAAGPEQEGCKQGSCQQASLHSVFLRLSRPPGSQSRGRRCSASHGRRSRRDTGA